jgi:hypothetical protein
MSKGNYTPVSESRDHESGQPWHKDTLVENYSNSVHAKILDNHNGDPIFYVSVSDIAYIHNMEANNFWSGWRRSYAATG